MSKTHIHKWIPLSIDEQTGYVFYFCRKCNVITFKEIKYVDDLITEEELNNKEYARIRQQKIQR